jgi:internalin A
MSEGTREREREGLRRIAEVERSATPLLDLSDLELTAIPDGVSRLTSLRELYLSRNQITAIPDSLSRLNNLQRLSLSHNLIAVIPDSLSLLRNLQWLRLSHNQIAVIPDSVSRLTNLETLEFFDNQIAVIPDSLSRLTNLRGLHLNENRIIAIPDSLSCLTNLRELYLSSNQITAIPDSLSRLTSLKKLGLASTQISAIPDSFSRLTNLQGLGFADNQITAIPDSFLRLTNLQALDLSGNPLPDELLAAARRSVETLFRYLKSAKHGDHPRTVKLVLLGEPQSGKTTLLEALNGNPHPCDPKRKQTLGVDVVTVDKAHPGDGMPMHLSVWDFAGQHMEHATHQFSLTKNAIFLILWNARQGAESGKRDLWYWLELLKMRVTEPKYLLVPTRTELTPADLNLSEIQSHYPGCEGRFPVEFETLAGFAVLEKKLLDIAAASPAMNAPWPRHWLPVRDEIQKIREDRPYMTPAEFRRLMEAKGVREELERKELAEQLHQLGEILYFQDMIGLSSLVILSPAWLTKRLAVVVRSQQARDNRGLLNSFDLDELWKDADLGPEVRAYLCRMMDQFDLTYSTGDSGDASIVVEALPYALPEDRSKVELPATQPRMEMIFRFPTLQRDLPPGIPTWGIARAHRLARQGLGPWRDIAFFEDAETLSQAVVSASRVAKEVRLSVAADYPPFFFGRMEAILRDTFRRYPGLTAEERLPCPCTDSCSYSYKFEVIKKLGKQGEPYVTCNESGNRVNVASLLTGFPPPQTEAGLRALEAELRRVFTMMLRGLNEQMKKRCPTVFTLGRPAQFKQLATLLESLTRNEELELCLYCEHDSGWHPTSQSLYRFRPNQEWVEKLKERGAPLAAVMLRVIPLVKDAGWAAELLMQAGSESVKSLSALPHSPLAPLAGELSKEERPEPVDIETIQVLRDLIEHLDSERRKNAPVAPCYGGLTPHIVEDGRLLWLCPDHLKAYEAR